MVVFGKARQALYGWLDCEKVTLSYTTDTGIRVVTWARAKVGCPLQTLNPKPPCNLSTQPSALKRLFCSFLEYGILYIYVKAILSSAQNDVGYDKGTINYGGLKLLGITGKNAQISLSSTVNPMMQHTKYCAVI